MSMHAAARIEASELRKRRIILAVFLSVLLVLLAIGFGVAHSTRTDPRDRVAACRSGELLACSEAFRALVAAEAVPEAWALASERCLTGDFGMCLDLQYLVRDHPEFVGAPPMRATYERACDRHPPICGLRGGLEIEANPREARRWYVLACERSSAGDCGTVGPWLLDGFGGPTDRATGLRYLEVGCLEDQAHDRRGRDPKLSPCHRLAREKAKDLTPPGTVLEAPAPAP